MTTSTQVETHTLEAPGATISYDIRRNERSTDPILLIIGSPMGAAGFVTLASHFADRTVVTYDPRGWSPVGPVMWYSTRLPGARSCLVKVAG